jgi:SulP family sulfate permease
MSVAPASHLRLLPAWLRHYRSEFLWRDIVAGTIVTIMLVPQSMAYAMLAGLPPEYGMYASVLPLIAYAWLGSSMTLAVGPVAVTSLMTAAALTPLMAPGSAEYIVGAAVLALVSGVMLFVSGLLHLGFIAKLLSNPVLSGFTSGSSLLILIGQIQPLFGMHADASGSALATIIALFKNVSTLHRPTALIGVCAVLTLTLSRQYLPPLVRRLCRSEKIGGGRRGGETLAQLLPKLVPMIVVLVAIIMAALFQWHSSYGVAVVGEIPRGLPRLVIPELDSALLQSLLFPAFAIGLVNFASSISVAQSLALQRRQKINADAELRALGAANIASAISGGFPVNGGFARSLVNFSANAATPLSGVISALLMVAVLSSFTGLFTSLPITVLAATIIVAVAPVIDIAAFRRAWAYDRADGMALVGTALGVLVLGVAAGIAIGVGLSLASLVWRSGHPHIAVLGRVPMTEQFRNILRYKTQTLPHVLALRIDENLLFANAEAVEERVRLELSSRPDVRHLLIVLSSVSQIDVSGMEMLTELNVYLRGQNILLHLAEVKGPVLDRLRNTPFLAHLSGRIFLSTHQAFMAMSDATEDYTI